MEWKELGTQEGDPPVSASLSNPLCPAVHETISCREMWHPLIMLPCTKQMQKWTWKYMEGKMGRHCENIQKQCEDGNSGTDRALGTNRKSMLPARLSHLTQGWMIHVRGFCLTFPRRSCTASTGRGKRKMQKGDWWGLDGQTAATENRSLLDNRNRQLC